MTLVYYLIITLLSMYVLCESAILAMHLIHAINQSPEHERRVQLAPDPCCSSQWQPV